MSAALAAVVTAVLIDARPAGAAEVSTGVTAYPASHFEASRPQTAFDLLALTPGYTFSDSDPDVRGLASAAGNVLIDGDLPATKHESLETLLRRIPASAVERIELIRAGASGIETYGHALLANVVRASAARTHGSVELESRFHGHDPITPGVAGDWSRESGAARVEVSVAAYRELGDEHGRGVESRRSPASELLGGALIEDEDRDRALELAAAYEHRSMSGKLRANAALMRERTHARSIERGVFPELEREDTTETEEQRQAELGAQYEHALSESLQWEALGLYRTTGEDETEHSVEESENALSLESSRASEAIVRTRLRRTSERWTWEAGAEGARNTLSGRSALNENGVDVPLPASIVHVEEQRGEAFASTSWRPNARWAYEAGLRFESSELIQDGEGERRKSFDFAKPRISVSYAGAPSQRWRMLIERRVGQLDFGDFVSSASLSDDVVTAGNPDLEPERAWVYELGWDATFTSGATLTAAVRRERISHLIDHLAAFSGEQTLDAIGNIGDGARNELELNVSAPLAALGLDSALLKVNAIWRSSSTRDPITGATRAISEDAPFEGELAFTHDLPVLHVHWGVEVEFAGALREHLVDEVRTERFGPEVNLFIEHTPTPLWRVRVEANNLADRKFERERRIYDGPRNVAPLEHIETRTLRLGRFIGVSVRRSFGG